MRHAPVSVSMVLALLAACGDDRGTPPIDGAARDGAVVDAPAIDAPAIDARVIDATSIDAAPSTVVEVPCAGATIASEVSAPGFAFTISRSSITVNSVVRFTMPGFHSAVSGATPGVADGTFRVGFNQVKCLRFTAAGSFPFWCDPHQFTGALTVTP